MNYLMRSVETLACRPEGCIWGSVTVLLVQQESRESNYVTMQIVSKGQKLRGILTVSLWY